VSPCPTRTAILGASMSSATTSQSWGRSDLGYTSPNFILVCPISAFCADLGIRVHISDLGIRVHRSDLGIGFRIYAIASILSGWTSTSIGFKVKAHPWG
jgi:hypothetical protein